jgi:hypothetical protein
LHAWSDPNRQGAALDSFLEGPSFDRQGNPWCVDIPFGLPETRAKLQGAGVSLFETSHAELKRFFPAEIEKCRGVVKRANLRLE